MNTAPAFQRVASSPGDHTSNWFRRTPDCGTPIFDALAATRGSTLEFMHSEIETELSWPRAPRDPQDSIAEPGFTAGNDSEGYTSD